MLTCVLRRLLGHVAALPEYLNRIDIPGLNAQHRHSRRR